MNVPPYYPDSSRAACPPREEIETADSGPAAYNRAGLLREDVGVNRSRGGKPLALLAAALAIGLSACSGQEAPGAAGDAPGDGPAVRIASSESALSLLTLLADEAEESVPGLRLTFLPPAHSGGAAAATHTGDADIGVLTRRPFAAEREFGLQYLHLARDGLVFATHRDLGVTDLSADQLRGIWTGDIENWSELGGEDLPIVVLDRPEHTSPKILLRHSIFAGGLEITPDALVLERPGVVTVSLVNLRGAIGYTSLGEIISKDLDLNVVSLNGVAPTLHNLEDGTYPLSRPIGMVIRPRPGRDVMRFFEFIYGDDGFRLMRSKGYSPIVMNLAVATIPERNVIRQEERYRPLVEYLSRKMGGRVRVRLQHLSSYDAVLHEFATGRANAAFFGSFMYAVAREQVGVEPIARPERDGVSRYRGLIFVRKDSGISDWTQLKGKSFAMIRSTTAGDLFPRVFLARRDAGQPERFFGEIVFAGSHDTSIRKVLDGEVDAGAAKDLVFRQLAAEDPRIDTELTILAESQPVPENALAIRPAMEIACISCHRDVGPGIDSSAAEQLDGLFVRDRLREELLGLDGTAEGRLVLEAFGADRFVETTDADYENLYRMIHEVGHALTGQ
jgi:phosphate transport system substrate-binding protein